jgi:hypothetical protein
MSSGYFQEKVRSARGSLNAAGFVLEVEGRQYQGLICSLTLNDVALILQIGF